MNHGWTRRRALQSLGFWMAGSPLLRAQDQPPKLIGEPPGRITPRAELVNVLEAEPMAERLLPSVVFAKISGSDRRAFDRIIFRPRMLVNVRELDLTVELFGAKMFAPILAGPATRADRFHSDGELGIVRGAGAAQAAVVISGRSSQPIEKIAGEAKTALWYQVYPEPDMAPVIARVQQAVKAGCRAVCLTVGTPYLAPGASGPPNPAKLAALGNPGLDWPLVEQVRKAAGVPLLLKGIMSPEEARTAVERGVNGIVVSNHGGRFTFGLATPIEVLPEVADAVGGKIPVLVDSNFRRGTDVVKALALGATAVMVTRPVLWGLAGYGAEGVQTVMEMLQSETARTMGLCGKPNLAALDRSVVRITKR
jgi:4-hydroxymandelate oxidase